MFIAVDENEKRIFAEKDLPRQKNYYCPICKDKVRLRCGDNNAPHFAHINACSDDFTHDMSEWHKSWQMLFPLSNREVVIKYGNETHRADVLCYGTVIEFQHSPISKSEFSRRNKFYTDAGKKVVWIFDLTELFSGYDESGRLYISGDCQNYWGNGCKFVWKHPWRFLEGCLPQHEENVEIFFHTAPFSDNPKSQDSDGYIDKIVWVDPAYKTSWGRFQTNNKIATGYDLWRYLKERWEQNSTKSNCDVSNQRNYKYQVDGEIIEAGEFEKISKKVISLLDNLGQKIDSVDFRSINDAMCAIADVLAFDSVTRQSLDNCLQQFVKTLRSLRVFMPMLRGS